MLPSFVSSSLKSLLQTFSTFPRHKKSSFFLLWLREAKTVNTHFFTRSDRAVVFLALTTRTPCVYYFGCCSQFSPGPSQNHAAGSVDGNSYVFMVRVVISGVIIFSSARVREKRRETRSQLGCEPSLIGWCRPCISNSLLRCVTHWPLFFLGEDQNYRPNYWPCSFRRIVLCLYGSWRPPFLLESIFGPFKSSSPDHCPTNLALLRLLLHIFTSVTQRELRHPLIFPIAHYWSEEHTRLWLWEYFRQDKRRISLAETFAAVPSAEGIFSGKTGDGFHPGHSYHQFLWKFEKFEKIWKKFEKFEENLKNFKKIFLKIKKKLKKNFLKNFENFLKKI